MNQVQFSAQLSGIKHKKRAIETDSSIQIIFEMPVAQALSIIQDITKLYSQGAYCNVVVQKVIGNDNEKTVNQEIQERHVEKLETMQGTQVEVDLSRKNLLASIHILFDEIAKFKGTSAVDEKKAFKEQFKIDTFTEVGNENLAKIKERLQFIRKDAENLYFLSNQNN